MVASMEEFIEHKAIPEVHKVTPPEKDVAIGYIHPGMVDEDWARSMMMVAARSGNRINGITQASTPRINKGRDYMIRGFLESPAQWLWMVDTDMTMPDYMLEALLDIADEDTRPIVGGLGFIYQPKIEPMVSPSIFLEKDGDYYRFMKYPENTLVKVAATGAYCLLVHRYVFEAIEEANPGPYPWYNEELYKEEMYGPDFIFCQRATELGFPIYVHTGLLLGHMKRHEIGEPMYRQYTKE